MNNTTVDALKDVYTELGGSAATVASMQTDAEVIEALSALVGSTIELPAVTSDDNGDVLTVVNGAWSKAEPSGGLPEVTSTDAGKALIVDSEGAWGVDDIPTGIPNVIYNATLNNTTVTIDGDKTADDIISDIGANKIVFIKLLRTSNNAIDFMIYSGTYSGKYNFSATKRVSGNMANVLTIDGTTKDIAVY